jgi:DNA-binding NarL/FixJ family response regulator
MIKVIINLVEDNEGDVIAVKELLRNNPLYELQCFTEANEFLSSLSKNIDLVISDLRMANYNPMDAIKMMRAEYPGIRIIVVSAAFTPLIYEQLFWYRVDGVVRKDGGYWPDRLMEWISHFTPDIIARKELTA